MIGNRSTSIVADGSGRSLVISRGLSVQLSESRPTESERASAQYININEWFKHCLISRGLASASQKESRSLFNNLASCQYKLVG
uniref:Uncharacterized protein n=1 Tax=Timema poppense TaxID=170557 RepID=A0A7R9DIU4_TIMPO|nr:unnamed protein product [Timema poppensis]